MMMKNIPVPHTKNALKAANITKEKVAITIKATTNQDLIIAIIKKMKVIHEMKTIKEMKIIQELITAQKMKLFKVRKTRRKIWHQESLSGLPEELQRKRRKK